MSIYRITTSLFVVMACALGSFSGTPHASAQGGGKAGATTVVARVVGEPIRAPHCGVIHVVVGVEYELVEVIEGTLSAKRFVGILSCPEMNPMVGEVRLKLTTRRPPRMPDPMNTYPLDLPRFYVVGAAPVSPPETKGAGRLIGADKASVEATRVATGVEDGWTRYGPNLAVRFEGDVVVSVRARISPALRCETAARWMGFGPQPGGRAKRKRWGCAWPGISAKHRLKSGVEASLRDSVFEVSAAGR